MKTSNILLLLEALQSRQQLISIYQGFPDLFLLVAIKSETTLKYVTHIVDLLYLQIFFFFFLVFSRATLTAYGGSQARGPTGAVAAGLRQSHRGVGSKPRLRPTPQLTVMVPSQIHQPLCHGRNSCVCRFACLLKFICSLTVNTQWHYPGHLQHDEKFDLPHVHIFSDAVPSFSAFIL